MAFFPRTFYNAEPALTPIFRLFDDLDRTANAGSRQCRRSGLPNWQPKFDVREVADAYELHGELPGVTKDNVNIDFTEPQTLVIRGHVERNYTAGTAANATAPALVEDTPMTETAAQEEQEEERPRSPHQATVEDEIDSESHESGFEEIVTRKAGTASPTPTVEAAPVEKKQKSEEKKQPDNARYWLTERSIGNFSRSFHFPARVDQDNVTAAFENGILSISVPKAKKHESRRIAIL